MGCNMLQIVLVVLLLVCTSATAYAAELKVNDAPEGAREWGFRPPDGQPSPTNPPGFVWRPQKGAVAYELECAREVGFEAPRYRVGDVRYNCHRPPAPFDDGEWFWRFRYVDGEGRRSGWSQTRSFRIGPNAVELPMPERNDLLSRIPRAHPRLFIRPEQIPELRRRAHGDLRAEYDALVAECEELLKEPPPTEEPPTYPPEMERGSDEWMDVWWGNRRYTIRLLNGAATLAFTRLLGGKEEYGQLARRLLMAAAEWDPKGSTGYRYNDEAGMPYNYYFARTYTFVNDLLTEQEREKCRQVMAVRGKEMYDHLCPRHLWRPYSSHSNRAWHFLGEVGVAFLDEIPEAADWVWFAANVFFNVYPVWCDEDGGWHEGSNYWNGYISRFTWWADVMRAAMGIDAYRKPYFSQVGYYPMYLQPPGTRGGGFGDLTAWRRSQHNRALMTVFAAQAQNPHWQWYVDAAGGPKPAGGYVGFIRGALPKVDPQAPVDLPTSRCFRGTGQAVLNTDLMDAGRNVEVIFKSSPFGTQSHGYESQNAFLLYAFGQRLLIRTGRRDCYGSAHHKGWMWQTRSVNSVTVDGQGQVVHSPEAKGQILGFHTSHALDYVAGEAAAAYGGRLDRFTRHILFVKPELIVIYDRLEAPRPVRFEWWLHSPTQMQVHSQEDIRVANGGAACRVSLLAPQGLELSLTDRHDPPPRPRIKLVEWHLRAQTPEPAQTTEFVSLLRPHRANTPPTADAQLHEVEGGYALEAGLSDGSVLVLLPRRPGTEVRYGGLATAADLVARRLDRNGQPVASLTVEGSNVRSNP